MQTKQWSLIESVTNVGVGLATALVIQIVVFPWFGIETTFGENFLIALIFTGVSIIRSYLMRRLFNWLHHVKGVGRQGYYVVTPQMKRK